MKLELKTNIPRAQTARAITPIAATPGAESARRFAQAMVDSISWRAAHLVGVDAAATRNRVYYEDSVETMGGVVGWIYCSLVEYIFCRYRDVLRL